MEEIKYISSFKSMISDLKNIKNIDIIFEENEYWDNVEDIKDIVEDLKSNYNFQNLTERAKTYFSLNDNFSFGYQIKIENEFTAGEFHFRALDLILTLDNYDEELGYEGQPEAAAKLFKTFRVIDSHPGAGDNKWGVISLVEGYSPPNEPPVYFVDRGRAFDMNMKYGDYLDALLETYAIYNWQYLYCDIDLSEQSEFSHVYNSLDKSLKGLSLAFPDKDFSKLRTMLEAKR